MKLSEQTIKQLIEQSPAEVLPELNEKENEEAGAKSVDLLLDAIKEVGYQLEMHHLGIRGTYAVLVPLKYRS